MAARATRHKTKFGSGRKRKPKLGTGKRFASLSRKVHSKALAAWIGRKKYGKKKFAKLSSHGRVRRRKRTR